VGVCVECDLLRLGHRVWDFLLLLDIGVLVGGFLLHNWHHNFLLLLYGRRFGLNPNSLLTFLSFLPLRFLLIFVSLTNLIHFVLLEFRHKRRVMMLSSLVNFSILTWKLMNIFSKIFSTNLLRRLWILLVHSWRWLLLKIPCLKSIRFHFLSQIILIISSVLSPVLRWILRPYDFSGVVFASMVLLILATLDHNLSSVMQVITIESLFIDTKFQVW
jgi:hypothetical protein